MGRQTISKKFQGTKLNHYYFKDTLVITQENKFYRYSLTWDEVKEIYEESLDRINFSLPPDRTIC